MRMIDAIDYVANKLATSTEETCALVDVNHNDYLKSRRTEKVYENDLLYRAKRQQALGGQRTYEIVQDIEDQCCWLIGYIGLQGITPEQVSDYIAQLKGVQPVQWWRTQIDTPIEDWLRCAKSWNRGNET